MRTRKVVLGILLLTSAVYGCDRKEVPLAGKVQRLGEPEYGSSSGPNMAYTPGGSSVASVTPKIGSPDGAALFAKHCVACHQVTGQGIPAVFPPLDGSPYVVSENVERIASIMLYGLMGPVHVNGMQYNSAMAPFGAQMTDDELAAVASYIRSSWTNKAGEVKPDVFVAMRKKWGSRGPFNISELGEEK